MAAAAAAGAPLAALLNARAAQAGAAWPRLAAGPLRFVAQAALPEGEAYEAFVARTAQVPTRDNLHDFFNALVWLQQPGLKRRLHELQAREIARDGVGARRGPLRDAVTLFDENGALLQAPLPLLDALRGRRWRELFVTHRALWREARLALVGHALMEKLVQPYKAITAHVLVVDEGGDVLAPLDAVAPGPHRKPFLPLPLLGVPGWWAENEASGFYDDAEVFRPPRAPAPASPSACISAGTSAASSRGR
ncbi:DUF3025 domain-containing protein [Caldimonas tepidiphila]|uniref:DUF3025 domain-containing protein n=1 Tax=Caldimonas tepidiphila TaxID=2315841 RepID=UPI001F0CBF80|nr:DUF3025 domain-containing protein [Caldimonas tepidiphila]